MVVTHSVATPERFATGLTYKEFLAQIKVNLERFEQNYEAIRLDPQDAAFLASLPERFGGRIQVLAIGEDW